MITIETIVSELNSAPEPLLVEVLGFIRAAKSKVINESNQVNRDRRMTSLLESFQTDEVTLETIDAEVEDVRAELYARQKAL